MNAVGKRSGASAAHHQRQYSDYFLETTLSSSNGHWLQVAGLQHLQSTNPPPQLSFSLLLGPRNSEEFQFKALPRNQVHFFFSPDPPFAVDKHWEIVEGVSGSASEYDKQRSKAMQIVAGMLGVSSVTIGGDDRNLLIVIGNEVDAVILTKSLIKKLGSATLVRVVPLDDGRFDQEQPEASMTYEGQSNNYGYYNYGQPKYGYYNIPPIHEQYPRPYYYQYQRPDE